MASDGVFTLEARARADVSVDCGHGVVCAGNRLECATASLSTSFPLAFRSESEMNRWSDGADLVPPVLPLLSLDTNTYVATATKMVHIDRNATTLGGFHCMLIGRSIEVVSRIPRVCCSTAS